MEKWWYSSDILTSALDEGEWSASHPRPLYLGNHPWYPLDRRLGGPQSQSGYRAEQKNLPLPGIKTQLSSHSPSQYWLMKLHKYSIKIF
jgi:hypothetical protein